MDEFLYLETDEEITSVIDKLKGLESDSVALVAPKGSSIVQSLVSLKLLKKEAARLKKDIAIVTADEVGQNLSTQVGLSVYGDVKSHKPLEIELDQVQEKDKYIEINEADEHTGAKHETKDESERSHGPSDSRESAQKGGIQVHRYDERVDAMLEDDPPSQEVATKDHDQPVEAASEPSVEAVRDMREDVAEHHIDRDSAIRRRAASVGYMGPRSVSNQNVETTRTAVEPNRVSVAADTAAIKKRKKNKPLIITTISILSVALLVFVDLLVTKMTINLQVEASVFEKNYDVTVEKDRVNPDAQNSIIGGRQIIKEEEFEDKSATSGEKDVGEKAKGALVLKNESGVDEQVSVGTTLKSNGIEFLLDSTVTVPKAELNQNGDKVLGQVSANVTAENVGSSGNLPAGTVFSILGKSKVSAVGATSGGSTKKVKIVTKTDIDNAKKRYQEKKSTDFLEDSDIQKGEVMPEGAGLVDMTEFSVDKSVGDEAEQITAKAKIKFTTMVYKQSDLDAILTGVAEKTLTDGKGLVLAEGDSFSATLKEDKQNIGQMILDGKIKSHIGPKLNLPEMVKSWRAKPISKVKNDLSNISGAELKSLSISPSFNLTLAPFLTRNIKINISYLEK